MKIPGATWPPSPPFGPRRVTTLRAALAGGRFLHDGRLGEALDARNRAVAACPEGKLEVTRQVCEGELGLREAAARFEELEALGDGQDKVLGQWEGPSAGRRAACRTVLRWAAALLRDDPRREEVLCRLERELDGEGALGAEGP